MDCSSAARRGGPLSPEGFRQLPTPAGPPGSWAYRGIVALRSAFRRGGGLRV